MREKTKHNQNYKSLISKNLKYVQLNILLLLEEVAIFCHRNRSQIKIFNFAQL